MKVLSQIDNANNINIADSGGNFTSGTVEGALAELKTGTTAVPPYTDDFVIGDWSGSNNVYTLTYTGATTGFPSNKIIVAVYESGTPAARVNCDYTIASNGDVVIYSDTTFAGFVIITGFSIMVTGSTSFAIDVPITDTANVITATNVEDAINELYDTKMASNISASSIPIVDSGNKITATNVEDALVEIATENTGDETKSTIESKLTGTITTHTHSAISAPWKGVLHSTDGNGDPNVMLQRMSMHTIEMTPTLLTISLARISYFKYDTAITFNKVRFFGIGATTGIYQLALYNGDTLARLWTSGTFNTTSQTWGSLGSALNITLAANQLYFIAVSANTTGTTAGLKCYGATTGRIGIVPKSWPASLDVDGSIVFPYGAEAQFAVTNGALPDPAATIAARGTMACGFPAIFLDSNNA